MEFVIAGRLIDGFGGPVRRNVLLTVINGTITAMEDGGAPPKQAIVHDFSHCTILPALIDCNVSLSRSPSVDLAVQETAATANMNSKRTLVNQHIHYCHTYGVLGLGDGDDETNLVSSHLTEIPSPLSTVIRTSGPLRTDTSVVPSDFIKVAYSASIDADHPSDSDLNLGNLQNILEKNNCKKMVLANGVQQVEDALRAGCDAIEQGYDMGEQNLKEMAKRGVLWIPNVLRAKNSLDSCGGGGEVCCRFSQRYVAPGKAIPGAETFWKKTLAKQIELLGMAHKLGVKTAIGTGAGSTGIVHGESVMEEMKLFIKAGYTLEETVRCGSENGAEFFSMDTLGGLKVGRQATFLISRGTVKQLPRKLSFLEGIYISGAPSELYNKNPVQQ